ncbi:hypothetical protein X801_10180 [Opisthorchis viverrini]|uniref:Uncharacterized protein n=1 Tax=Opisthorchis viverrini TaxID=6198 RepID=A0A1S8WHV0_OPIVI|nr:hypothetical protein X801_10180 [Opisthorchis viverrini]
MVRQQLEQDQTPDYMTVESDVVFLINFSAAIIITQLTAKQWDRARKLSSNVSQLAKTGSVEPYSMFDFALFRPMRVRDSELHVCPRKLPNADSDHDELRQRRAAVVR